MKRNKKKPPRRVSKRLRRQDLRAANGGAEVTCESGTTVHEDGSIEEWTVCQW